MKKSIVIALCAALEAAGVPMLEAQVAMEWLHLIMEKSVPMLI